MSRSTIAAAAGLGAILLLTSGVGSLPAYAEDPGDAGRGHTYAAKICAECHGIEADDGGSPNFTAPPFNAIANTPGMSARALVVWLQNPHPTMPSLVLPVDDMHDVIAYILTLKDEK